MTELTANLRALKCEEETRARELDTLKAEVNILRDRVRAGSWSMDPERRNTMNVPVEHLPGTDVDPSMKSDVLGRWARRWS